MRSKTSAFYQVSVEGYLDERWLRWFEGMAIEQDPQGNTLISGEMDQSCLFGVLNRIRDLGMVLVAVQRSQMQSETE